jgi:hypothetical protein
VDDVGTGAQEKDTGFSCRTGGVPESRVVQQDT